MEEDLELLLKQFILHRTETHELLGSKKCKTCEESTKVIQYIKEKYRL